MHVRAKTNLNVSHAHVSAHDKNVRSPALPTRTHTPTLTPLFSAPAGLLVTVGSARTFLDAVANPTVSHIVVSAHLDLSGAPPVDTSSLAIARVQPTLKSIKVHTTPPPCPPPTPPYQPQLHRTARQRQKACATRMETPEPMCVDRCSDVASGRTSLPASSTAGCDDASRTAQMMFRTPCLMWMAIHGDHAGDPRPAASLHDHDS